LKIQISKLNQSKTQLNEKLNQIKQALVIQEESFMKQKQEIQMELNKDLDQNKAQLEANQLKL
jgi:hypothetical protein